MDIPVEIAFKDTEKSEALHDAILERVEKLERLHHHIVACRVVVTVPHRSSDDATPALGISVEVSLPGAKMVVAKDEEERGQRKTTPGVLLGRVFDRIERQIRDDARIRQGDVKGHAADGTTGRVARLFPDQNYGFIEIVGSPDLYFTRNAVLDMDYDELEVGASVRVTVATTDGPMGPQASSVRRMGDFQTLL